MHPPSNLAGLETELIGLESNTEVGALFAGDRVIGNPPPRERVNAYYVCNTILYNDLNDFPRNKVERKERHLNS